MAISKLVKELNKAAGKNVIAHGAELMHLPRFSTGSLILDAESGGGIPEGKITSLVGEESSGKSVVALKATAEYQKKYPNKDILWIDAEGSYTPDWARALGVDVDAENFYVMRPEYMEQAYDAAMLATDENCGLVVIDSLASMSPKAEAEEEIEKQFVGVAARLHRKLFRKFQSAVNDPNFDIPTTLLYINHLNEKVGASSPVPGMPPPLIEPGGRALRFFPSLKIQIKAGDKYPKSRNEGDEPKAQAMKFHITKNKTAPPFRRGHFWFFFDTLDEYRVKGSYDRIEEIVRYGKKYNVIQTRGKAYFDVVDPNTGEVESFHGSNALAEYLRTNEKTRAWVEQEVLQRVQEGLIFNGRVSTDEEVEQATIEQETGAKSSSNGSGPES